MSERVVYISIGNSDDKLTQEHWHDFYEQVRTDVYRLASEIHGEWVSLPTSRYQNACWAIVPRRHLDIIKAKADLGALASAYLQDSIAWAECPETEFLKGGDA